MRSYLFVSALTIALTVVTPIVSAIVFPEVAVAQSVAKQKKEADRLLQKGVKQSQVNQYEAALQSLQQALVIYRELKDGKVEGQTLFRIGAIYQDLPQYPKALEVYRQALAIHKKEGDLSSEATTLSNMGIIYRRSAKYSKALEVHQQALGIREKIGERRGLGTTLNSIGMVYTSLGDTSKALAFFQRSLAIRDEVGDVHGKIITLENMGDNYLMMNDDSKALEVYQQALRLSDPYGIGEIKIIGRIRLSNGEQVKEHYLSDSGTALNGICGIHFRRGDYAKALGFCERFLRSPEGNRDQYQRRSALNSIGTIYSAQRQNAKALEYYHRALVLAKNIDDLDGQGNTLSNIGAVLVDQNQPELAILFFKQSVNLRESIRERNRQLPRDLQSSYTKTVAVTYRNLAYLLIQQRRLPEAQAVLELLKLRELRDFTRDTRAIDSPGISLANIEKNALTEILKSFSTIGNFSQQLSECEKTNCPTLTQLETQRDKLNSVIKEELKTQRKLLADHYSTESATLSPEKLNEEARRIVNAQDGTVLIYPLILKDKIQFLLAFKSNQGGVTFRPFETNITAETLTTTITQFRNQLENPGDINTLKATSQTLYNALIKPLEPELKAANIKHLVFAPDSTIRYIPLAALHDGKQYLIQRYTISTITAASQTNTTEKSPRPIAGQNQLLAMGASTFPNTQFSSLLNVPIELDSITTTKPGDPGIYPGTEVLDRAFNFDSIKTNLKTGTYKILHLATHGAFIPGNVEQSYIIPGSGPNLTSDRIDALANNAGFGNLHLVVLSACQTGVGDRASDGIEIPGISHFFLKNNVKSVLASLWNVSDASTALLMQKFYTYLAQGKTKAQALQQVQTEFLNSTLTTQDLPRAGVRLYRLGQLPPDSLAHPYFWAPFILIGNSL